MQGTVPGDIGLQRSSRREKERVAIIGLSTRERLVFEAKTKALSHLLKAEHSLFFPFGGGRFPIVLPFPLRTRFLFAFDLLPLAVTLLLRLPALFLGRRCKVDRKKGEDDPRTIG